MVVVSRRAPAAPPQPVAAPRRPNLVFVLVDDMRWDDLGAAGHPFIETPHMDRLAREGARFTNAFATTPLCSPSRASFLTGQYPHTNGIIDSNRPLARPRLNAFLLGIFGLVALLLSAVGLYAVMAAYVRDRDREIALRLALGATVTGVRRLVLAETVRLAGLGVLIGLAATVGATCLVRGMLFEVHPLDPWAILGAAALLIAASTLASYIPARRATRVDAMAMLRSK